ncbi:Uncharacterised protein [Mycobacterium tuberculosis]|uniref:Uncharacterized protein n=1 Tax=Mycobacterium tuberculosis TaxID=1773 RepID=A0A655FJ18_MYCTX|nr:Uncharacterised protein [Mycobacterium tuberculosis]CNU39618.1 Uncharacterised protein [Mycobacterium tuberculosis]CNV78802.1 Uncharacterised protein [Mycobacterium tuberculosis]CNW04719.1 Uncharacterised protein [Mycobacterium tuberculosis]
MPVSVGCKMPSCSRNLRPILAVTCADVAEIPNTWFTTAIGSPGMLALGIMGSVGSHKPSHARPPAGPDPGSHIRNGGAP